MGQNAGKVFASLRRSLDVQRKKRDDYNLKVKELSGSIRLLREQQDSLNAEVRKLKELRNSKQEEVKPISVRANALRSKIEKAGEGKMSLLQLKSLVEKLEFDYETKPMSFQNEKKAVQKIEKTKRALEKRERLETEFRNVRDIERKIKALKGEAQVAHEKMIGLVKQSEKVHQEMTGYRKQLKNLRGTADESHKQVIELSTRLKEMRKELAGKKDAELKRLFKTKAKLEREREGALRRKAEKIEAEFKTRKRFNIRELQILQHVGKDTPFIKRKPAKSKKR